MSLHLPGTSMFANKLSFLSFRATLNTNLQAPVRLLPVTSNCVFGIRVFGGCRCSCGCGCGYCVRVCDGGGGDGYTDVEKR